MARSVHQFKGMDDSSGKEIRVLAEELERLMLEILALAPGEGWHHITVAQRNALRAQVKTVYKREARAG